MTTDTAGPIVSAIKLNKTIVEASAASQTITATISVTDATGVNLARLPSPYWYNVTDIGGTRINSEWVLITGDIKDGTYSTSIVIPTTAKAGDWSMGFIAFYDTLGYSSTNGGYAEGFKVVTSTVSDTAGPIVSAINLNKPIVDISATSQTITATVNVTDATGVNLARLPSPYWYNVTDIGGTRRGSDWVLTAGNIKDGTYSTSIVIPTTAKAGDWSMGFIAFYDTLGYSSTNGGYEQGFKVTSIASPVIRNETHNLSFIVDKGVLSSSAVYLKGLTEKITFSNNIEISRLIEYSGQIYTYSQIDSLVMTVTRDDEFTSEFTKEINDYLKTDSNITYANAVAIVGAASIDSVILSVAGADGNFIA